MKWSLRKRSKALIMPAQQPVPDPQNKDKSPAVEKEALPSPSAQGIQPTLGTHQAAQPVLSQPAQTAPTVGIPSSARPRSVPSELGLSANEEVNAIWLQVQERVRLLAESEGKEVNFGLEVDDVIRNLEVSQEKGEESPTREAVRVAFGRTMGLIKTVGGIVADGAATVFAPAGQCYNAISFLINAYDGYQGAFDGLAELLEKCSDHLGRLDYYVKGGMDTRLSKVAAEQLLLFVQICDAALKLRHSAREKVKTGLKIAFLAENSIQGLLGEMAKLAERERGLVSAQTFQLASAAAASAAEGATSNKQILDTLAQNGADQKQRAEYERSQQALVDFLAFDRSPDRWDNDKKVPLEIWQRRYNSLRKGVVPGTGMWLLRKPAFKTWISDLASYPILGVEGIDISGKSYLTSSVIKYLRTDAIAHHPGYRHLTAFYFLDREDGGHGLDAMAKSLVWQLADKDRLYMKSATRIGQQVGVLDPGDVLPQLLSENTELEQMDAVFHLVIDGLGDVLDASLLNFLQAVAESRNKKIRVFLSGTPRAFEQMRKGGLDCASIPISRNNRDDIEKFIEFRMDTFDALADTERPGVLERRKQIREGLSQAVSGDYYKLNSAMNIISTLDYMEDINSVIRGAGDDRSKQLHDEIEMLNRERSLRQIQEINQIILWVTFAVDPVSENLASAALYLITGEAPLRSLAEQFRTKYLLFEVDRKGFVGFRSSNALNVIPGRSQLTKYNNHDNQEIQRGEIDMILHFLDNVCPPALFKKLEIRDYLEKKVIQKQDQIHQEDENTGHLRLALDCLRALGQEPNESIVALQQYARQNLICHLAKVDLAMVDRDQKSQVGEWLLRLFTENDCIDAFMGISIEKVYGRRSRMRLLDGDSIDQIVRWFRDTAVVSSIADDSDRSWIQSVISGNTLEALLRPAMVRMAHHCLREPLSNETTSELYSFIVTFLSKVNSALDNHGDTSEAEKDKLIAEFEQWAYEVLRVPEKDTIWHTQMGIIYVKARLQKQAMERCELALQMDPNNWRASLCRTKVTPPPEAVEVLRTLLSQRERDSEWMQRPAHLDDLADLNYELAEKYCEMQQFDLALPFFVMSVKQAPTCRGRARKVFLRYRNKMDWANTVSFLSQFAMVDDGKHLGDMVVKESSELYMLRIHESIWISARETNQFMIVDTVFKAAIQRAEKIQDYNVLTVLFSLYGVALLEQPNPHENMVIQLWEAALWDHFPLSELPTYVLDFINGLLAPFYLQRALVAKANLDPDSVSHYLARLSDMVPEGVASSQLFLPPQLWQARFYHLSDDDAKARQIVRPLVQVALGLLSDEDQSNDWEAFRKLRFILIALSDDENALAALALEARERLLHESCIGSEDRLIWCSGQCDHHWDVAGEMWICKDCISLCLDIDCISKLKEGRLKENKYDVLLAHLSKMRSLDNDHLNTLHRGNLCNPDHDFIKVPKWDGSSLDLLPREMVPWGEQNITVDEWKKEIRKAYVDVDS